MADSSSTTNWLQPTAADWIGLGAATMAAIITKGASLGESGSVSQEVTAAENAVNYFFGIVGGAPGVIQATATGGASKDGDAGKLAAQAFVRETEAATLGYFVGAAADVFVGGLLAGASITVGAPVVVAAVAIAAGYVASKYVSDELEKSDAVANAAAKAAAAAASSTANTDPISDRQYTLDDGSLCTVGTNGTLSVQTTLGTYQYDTAGNPFSFTDTSGISLNYNSATGQVTGVNTSTPLEGLLTFGAGGIQITDQNTGINSGTLSLDSAGALQLSQSGAGTLTVPNSQSNQDISFAKDNGDGTITTTTASANGNSIVSTETDANGNILLTSITDISTGTNQSTTNFMGADGNSLGSLQTTSTVDANSTTTVSAQLDANGLLLGTTLTVTNNDGSSEVTSKDGQGNTLSEQAIASDGSAVITTFNSSTDPNLNSTVSKDSNGDISETSTTVAGDTPGSYVSTTLDASGALIEKETQTTDSSGTTDHQAYYESGALSSSIYIEADGSRTETQYENPNDPKITQSSHFDDNGDLVSQSSTQKNESDGSYLTTTTNPSGQTLSTLVEQADGSTTQTTFNDPSDANLKTVIEDDAQGDLVGVSTTTVGTDSDYLTVRQNGDGETTGTDKTTITYDDQGQKTEHIQSYDGNGVPTGSNDEVTSPDGHVSANINGTGVGADLSNATVTLAPDAQANVTGTGNTFAIDSGASLVSQAPDGASGSQQGNQFALSSGAILVDYEGNSTVADIITQAFGATGTNVTLNGGIATTELSGATITTQNGTTLTVVGDNNCVDGNCTVAIDGDGNQFTLHAGDIASINGNNNMTTAVGDGAQLSVAGANNSVDATGGIITLDDGTSTTLTGDDNQLSVGSDVAATIACTDNTATLTGSDSTITASDDAITLLGADNAVAGSGDTIAASNNSLSISNASGGASDILTGDSNTITANGSAITLDGANEVMSGDSNTVNFGDDSSVAMSGTNSTINLGSYSTVTMDGGSGNTVFSGSDNAVFSGLGDTVVIGSDESNDTIVAANSVIALNGSDETVIGHENTLNLAGADASVSGYSDTINLNATASGTISESQGAINVEAGATLIANFGGDNTINADANSTINLASSEGGDTVTASNDTIILDGSSNTVLGDNNTLNTSGFDETVTGNNNDLDLSADASASIAGTQNVIDMSSGASLRDFGEGGNTINADGDNNASVYIGADTLNVNGSVLSLSGSNDIVVGDNNTLSMNGSSNIVSGGDDVLTINSGDAAVTLTDSAVSLSGWGTSLTSDGGAGNTINSQWGDQVTVGSAESNDSILANGSALALGGSGESVSGAYNTLDLAGTDETVSGYYDTISLGAGSSATVTEESASIALDAGASLSDNGYNNTVSAAANDTLVLNGHGDSVSATDSALTLNDQEVHVLGDDNTLVANSYDEYVTGSNNTIDLEAGSSVIMGGSQNTANLSSDAWLMGGGDGGNTINVGSGDTVIVGDSYGDTHTENGDVINASGSNNVITLNDSDETVSGNNNTFISVGTDEMLSGSDDSLSVYGSAAVSSTDSAIDLQWGGSVTSNGGGDNTISISGPASDTTPGATLVVGSAENNDKITADYGTITLNGAGETVTGGDNVLALAGTGESVSGDYDTVSMATGSSATLSEYGANISLNSGASLIMSDINGNGVTGGNTISAATNDTIAIGSGESSDTIVGSDDRITLSDSDTTLTIEGNGDSFAAAGTNDRIVDNRADGTSVLYDWNGSGGETDTVYSGANNSGDIIGGYGYTGTGPGADLPGSYGGGETGGDGGGYGFAGAQSLVSSGVGANIGTIAQYDLNHGNLSAAASAEAAQQQAASIATLAPTSGTGSAVLEGAKWDQQVITWSVADSSGTQAAPFSGYMGSAEESVVQAAFNTWASATPGVTFEEVSDSAQSDIRVGFGDFNTATTGVVGYTSYQANDGQIAPDAIVRVEDTAQDALATAADGQPVYSGSGALLSQVLLHEIGHALGLGDNADQNSVMNYQLTASNRTLDRTDLVGIGSLYGAGAITSSVGSSGVSQLIQAMSTFNADAGVADTTLLPPTLANNNVTLSASAHAA